MLLLYLAFIYKVLRSILNRFCANLSDKIRVFDLSNRTVQFYQF
jgi:hypothetical protein